MAVNEAGYDRTYGNTVSDILNSVARGDVSASEAQRIIANNSAHTPLAYKLYGNSEYWRLTAEQENYLNNMIAQEVANSANDFTREMRDTDITSAGEQLNKLGLASSGVLQTGGSMGPSGAVADTTKYNHAEQVAGRSMAMAKGLISMAGSMASAGIYGAALRGVKSSAAKVAATSAHSAQSVNYGKMIYDNALKSSYQNQMDDLLKRFG